MFESADLKIKRAQEHINDLEKAFRAFIDTHSYTFHIDQHPHTGAIDVEVRLSEAIPIIHSLTLGDAIHNLRTALDHATWELIGIDGGTQDRQTMFPFRADQKEYESTCEKIKTPFEDSKKFFIDLAAYPGGAGEKLYGLNRLDIVDKHTILTPVVGVATIGALQLVHPNGISYFTMTNVSVGMGPDGRAKLLGNVDPSSSIQFDHSNSTLDIFFRDVEFFQGPPILETLLDLSSFVSNVIGRFAALVEARRM